MPICITCSTPVKNLYTTYSKADDRSLGKGVRLTQCPNCKRFADKYVEHDYVVLFIDLVLIKPQVYRHLLFNRLDTPNDALDPSILRLGILLILFDVYITWARIERTNSPSSSFFTPTRPASNFSSAPIITQYMFFLTLNVVATVVQHGVIRSLAKIIVKPSATHTGLEATTNDTKSSGQQHKRTSSSPSRLRAGRSSPNPDSNQLTSPILPAVPHSLNNMSASTTALDELPTSRIQTMHPSFSQPALQQIQPQPDTSAATSDPKVQQNTPGGQASPAAISTALLVSSCTKLFPILLVIWPITGTNGAVEDRGAATSSSLAPFAHRATSYIGWVVLLNNIEALLILLDCGYIAATTLAVAGIVSRWVLEGWLLGLVGLVRELEGPVGDVINISRWILGLQ